MSASESAPQYPANATATHGDLMAASVEALVNPVNCVGAAGAGLAVTMKERFPLMYESYRDACHAGAVQPGRIHVWKNPEAEGPRYILNLPTKRHFKDPSEFRDVVDGLKALIDTVNALGIRSLALPALGCGHGNLEWARMERVLCRAAAAMPQTTVQIFAPNAALQRPARRQPPHRNGRSR